MDLVARKRKCGPFNADHCSDNQYDISPVPHKRDLGFAASCSMERRRTTFLRVQLSLSEHAIYERFEYVRSQLDHAKR